jgi:hypothetical protein
MGGSKSGGAGQFYDYYGTLAGGLCVGPVSDILSIILNGQEAWPRGTAWVLGATCSPGTLYVFDAQTWTCTTQHVATAANAPGSGLEGWTEYTFKYHGSVSDDFSLYSDDGTFQGVLRLYWGTAAQTTNDYYLQTANNDGGVKGNIGVGDNHPPYTGVCYCVLIDFLLGEEIQSGPNIEVVLRRPPNQTLLTGNPALITDGQANLAAVLVEVLTDPNCLGLATSMIDAPSFQTAANWLDTNQAYYGASVLIDSSESLRSFLDKAVQMIDGWIRFNPTTQKIELGVYEHGAAPATYANVVELTADNLTKIPTFNCDSWQETYSRATVRYNSRQLVYQETSVYADDPRAFFVLGVARDQALDRPYLAREGQALLHGRETLRVIGHAQMHGEIEVRREFGRSVRAGDFVFVNVELEPNGASIYQYFRVTQRKIPPTGPITLTLFADNTLAPVPFSTQYPTTPPGNNNVSAITSLRVVQVPENLSGLVNAITVLAVRPDNLVSGCLFYFDTARVLSTTITSLVADSTGANGVITFAAAPGFAVDDDIDVSCSGNSAFNISQGTVTAVSGLTVTYALAVAVAANLAATGTITVADYYTTFSNLGQIPNFAANATLTSAVTAAQTTITLTVDTTQADADYFTNQYTANDAANDTMLLFLVHLVGGSGADANQIAESNGFGIIEICSVSTQTLLSAGQYQLTVLRGRQGTNATAFTVANTECWLIPRTLLAYFTSGAFDIIRANRIANTVPQYAQFRFCPYDYAGQLPLSSAVNHQFRFPLKSANAPALTLTSPGSGPFNYANPTLPLRILVAGTWTDSGDNLVEAKLLLDVASESSPRTIFDVSMAQTGSYTFSKYVQIDKAGSWTIQLIARDSTGMTTEVDIAVNVTGGVAKCAMPELFDCNGNEIVNGAGDFASGTNKAVEAMMGWHNGSPNTTAYYAEPAQWIPFGKMSLACSTPGASIQFFTFGVLYNGGELVGPPAITDTWFSTDYSTGFAPFHSLLAPTTTTVGSTVVSTEVTANYWIIAMATASGYADSCCCAWKMPLFI